MPKVIEGTLNADGKRFGIVVGRFNAFISKELLGGALDCLKRHGAVEWRAAGMRSVRVIERKCPHCGGELCS